MLLISIQHAAQLNWRSLHLEHFIGSFLAVTHFNWLNQKNHSLIHPTRKYHTSVAFLWGFLKLYNSCNSSYSVFEKGKKKRQKIRLFKWETKSAKLPCFRKIIWSPGSFLCSSTAGNSINAGEEGAVRLEKGILHGPSQTFWNCLTLNLTSRTHL